MANKDPSHYLNKIFLGEVASVHNYGAFVKIPGGNLQGLVHKSQVSSGVVDDVCDVLQKGERVWCKVIKITDDGKLALSMKVVNQGSGKDLDPNGVQIHQDELKRKSKPERGGRKVITLEAVLNTTCNKCGTKGHLAKDCFKSPDGKTYELIPEEDDDNEPLNQSIDEVKGHESKEEKKLRKKLKKLKKKEKKEKEKRKNRSESSDSSDSEREKYKHKKKKLKHKKEKKEERRSEKRPISRSPSPSDQRKKH